MDIALALAILLAAAAGLAVGYGLARSRGARLDGELAVTRAEVDRLRLERGELATRASDADRERAALTARLDSERAAAAEKVALLEQAQSELTERFRALSADALEHNSRQFLQLADSRMKEVGARATGELEQRRQAVEHLVTPLADTLGKVQQRLEELERSRARSSAALEAQIHFVRQTGEELRDQTAALATALRKPQTRGQWGELQLRRVVEVAGMLDRCDFETQTTVVGADGAQRPDMVVHLAGGKHVVVDAKAPLAAFLEAIEASDEAIRSERMTAHARHLRSHVDMLSGKAYWQRLSATPEFVVLFVPGEAILAQALDADPTLLEYAAGRRIILATPITLITLLRTVAYAWTEEAVAENARYVLQLGRELYQRIAKLGDHVDKLGRALTTAVGAYNQTVGNLETRVLVSARKLKDLQVVDDELPSLEQLETAPRPLVADELAGTSTGRGAEVVALPMTGATAGPRARAE
jgi:DNA recombination protein RmuC